MKVGSDLSHFNVYQEFNHYHQIYRTKGTFCKRTSIKTSALIYEYESEGVESLRQRKCSGINELKEPDYKTNKKLRSIIKSF